MAVNGPHAVPETQNAPRGAFAFLAERVGFEPTLRQYRKPDFESGAFDHSATSPKCSARNPGSTSRRIVRIIPDAHPSLRSGPAFRLSEFVPDKFVDHSATPPKCSARNPRS